MRSASVARTLFTVLALLTSTSSLVAQPTRSVNVSRQLVDSQPVTVRIELAMGQLQLGPAQAGRLYELEARYTPGRGTLSHRWSGDDARALHLGLDQASLDLGDEGDKRRASELRIGLTGGAPIDLGVDVGAASAELNHGGHRLSRLKLESGASDTKARFDSPNPQPMSMLEVSAGAAEIELRGLANANASEMSVTTGVGTATLDFDGEWRRDLLLRLDVKVGSVRLRVPRGVGVRVQRRGPFARLEQDGMVQRGDAWETPGWDKAARKLTVLAETWLGKVVVERQ
jgi:hypothetical protein